MVARTNKKAPAKKASQKKKSMRPVKKGSPVRLLAGGNPQIAKGDGAAPVAAYLASLPVWNRAVGERLDTLIVKSVPASSTKSGVVV